MGWTAKTFPVISVRPARSSIGRLSTPSGPNGRNGCAGYGGSLMKRCSALTVAVGLWICATGRGDPPLKGITPGSALGLLGSNTPGALSGNLRAFLLKAMPDPLYEDLRHWDLQKPVREVHWRGQGLNVYREVREVPKNDGHWWKVRVTAPNLADTLVVDLRDVQQPEPGRLTFTTFLSLDAHVDYDWQNWRNGHRMYAGSVRARLRLKLTLRCEATGRLEGNGILPEAVIRLRVVQSEAGYDNFVAEHIPGIGGEMAKVLGDAARAGMQQWHPSLERNLLARANEAILKAGDTKEVRVGLAALLGKSGAGQ